MTSHIIHLYQNRSSDNQGEAPGLLWVNLSRVPEPSRALQAFAGLFSVAPLNPEDIQRYGIQSPEYAAIMFEYDYPDRAGLEILRQTKQQFPAVPVIMLTEHHSESLAVWALRTRVLDYLVKPLTEGTIEKLSAELAELSRAKAQNTEVRRPLGRRATIPYEARIGAYIANANSVKTAANYIDRNLKEKITCSELAKLCGMDSRSFSVSFKKAYGVSFQRYHLQRRIEEAASLLGHPDAAIVDIAYTVGFRDASYFTRSFKYLTGFTPSEYRAIQFQQDTNSLVREKKFNDRLYLSQYDFSLGERLRA